MLVQGGPGALGPQQVGSGGPLVSGVWGRSQRTSEGPGSEQCLLCFLTVMGERGAGSGLRTPQGGRGEQGAGFVISPRGSPQGAKRARPGQQAPPRGATADSAQTNRVYGFQKNATLSVRPYNLQLRT